MSTHVFHRDVWYVGHVQGVGFRAQTLAIARGFEVTGFVQNLTDGRVYLHVEGAEDEVVAFTDQVAASLVDYIKNTEVRDFNGIRTCKDFAIHR
jgi:acylphosphatase